MPTHNTHYTTREIKYIFVFFFRRSFRFVLFRFCLDLRTIQPQPKRQRCFSLIIHFGNLYYSQHEKSISRKSYRGLLVQDEKKRRRIERKYMYVRRRWRRQIKMRCNLNNTAPEGKYHLPDKKWSVEEWQKKKKKIILNTLFRCSLLPPILDDKYI